MCLCSPLPPQGLLPYSLCRFKQTGEGVQVSADFMSFSLSTGLAPCFSQDLSNTQN